MMLLVVGCEFLSSAGLGGGLLRQLMNSGMFLMVFILELGPVSDGVLVECPSDIAFSNSLFEFLVEWFAVVGTCRVLISR